jgi:ADP-ribose pyrophosphatase YjhB (NUDIX family)
MRTRGTAIVLRNQAVLLVRDLGKKTYSLPGGGANRGEPSLAAAVRELKEELGMSAHKAERLFKCDFDGSFSRHKVSLIETNDNPRLNAGELEDYIWWDMIQDIPRFRHVDAILEAYTGRKLKKVAPPDKRPKKYRTQSTHPKKRGAPSMADIIGRNPNKRSNHYEHKVEGSWLGPPKKGQHSTTGTSADEALDDR